MAGSRLEKIGTIFSRINGLLKSGAIRSSDKPVWFDVWAAFPPKVEPKFDRMISARQPIDIIYREDIARAHFFKTYVTYAMDMTNENLEETSEKFAQKYLRLREEQPDAPDDDVFVAARDALEDEGVTLKTFAEVQQARENRVSRNKTLDSLMSDVGEESAAEAGSGAPRWRYADLFDDLGQDEAQKADSGDGGDREGDNKYKS